MNFLEIMEGCLTVATFLGVVWTAFKWIDKTNDIQKNLSEIRKEQRIHSKAILGILDGQHQQGLNHRSQDSYAMMLDHLNEAAHND